MGVELSVVIPVYDERGNLIPLYERLQVVLDEMQRGWEVLFVDDGSSDGSQEVLREIAAKDPRVKVILLRRNFGQTAAIAAGVEQATGRVIVTMDADLQNDPEDIPRLLDKLEEGYDVVSGWRRRRQEPFLTRRFPSMVANRLISFLTGVKLHDYGCSLKAYRREIFKDLRLYGEMHRFIPACASWVGAKIAEVEVKDHRRRYGRSKYGLSRIFSVLLDLITMIFLQRYSTKPMRLFGGTGLMLLLVGGLTALFVIYRRLFLGGQWMSPMILIAFFFAIMGVMFILLGLVAELIIRTYHESQGKPIYVIRETYNLEKG